jgi:hypothetical protein
LVNATAITSITGVAVAVLNAVDNQATMSTAANVAVTVTDATVAAATLNSINAATTGLVTATAVTTITGSIAEATAAQVDQSAILTAPTVNITVNDVTATAASLNNLDFILSAGVVNASTVTTVTGSVTELTTAFQSAGITFAPTADATVTGTSTITQLNTLNATGVDVITFGTAFATTTTDVIDLTAAGFDAGAHTIKYTAGNQTVAFNFTDLGAAGFGNGDTFTHAGAADVIKFDANDILDLTAFGLGSLNAPTALYTGTNEKVGDNEWTMVRGTWAAGTFTVAAAGADTLVLWDSNAAGVAVTQSAVVITGVPALTFGSTILV